MEQGVHKNVGRPDRNQLHDLINAMKICWSILQQPDFLEGLFSTIVRNK